MKETPRARIKLRKQIQKHNKQEHFPWSLKEKKMCRRKGRKLKAGSEKPERISSVYSRGKNVIYFDCQLVLQFQPLY